MSRHTREGSDSWEQIPMDEEDSNDSDPIQDEKENVLEEPTTETPGEEEEGAGVLRHEEEEPVVSADGERSTVFDIISNVTAAVIDKIMIPLQSSRIIVLSEILSVIAVAVGCWFIYHIQRPSRVDAPKLHCPNPVLYAPLDGNPFYINASHSDHPVSTQYKWDVIDMLEIDDLFFYGEDTDSLVLMKGTGGQIDIELVLSVVEETRNIVFDQECSLSVVFYESPYFGAGIDLGTTYSCIAYQEHHDKVMRTKIVVADKDRAEYCIPTAVYFPSQDEESQEVIIGEDALKKLATDPENVIFDIKRIVGRPCDDPQIAEFQMKHEFNVTCDGEGDGLRIWIPNLDDGNGDYIAPEQVLAVILAHLVEIASLEFGVPYISDVVVSIPALFHNGQRKAIRSACDIAGLNVRQLVVEPTAAALAYSYYSSTPADNFKLFLTFDMGGGTIDCSVLRCTGVDCQVLGVKGNSSLGGIDFDYIIRDIMVEKFRTQHGWDNIESSPKLFARFLKAAERVKKSLSVSTQHQVTMANDEIFRDWTSTTYTEKKQVIITRKEFEDHPRTQELIDSAIRTAKEAISTDGIQASNIRMILMVGGTTKIPIIQQRLKEEFGAGSFGRDLELVFPDEDPQLMVVKGSSVIGASLIGNVDVKKKNAVKDIVLEDAIPLSLGFGICSKNDSKCGVMDVIIEKNSHYPTREQVTYCQKDPKSSVAKLDLYEGENEMVKDNYLLSHLSISGIPPRDPNTCDSIIVEFIIDENGIAMIEAVINDNRTANAERQKFTNTLSVKSEDGNLSIRDIQALRKGMIGWFPGRESIQRVLMDQ